MPPLIHIPVIKLEWVALLCLTRYEPTPDIQSTEWKNPIPPGFEPGSPCQVIRVQVDSILLAIDSTLVTTLAQTPTLVGIQSYKPLIKQIGTLNTFSLYQFKILYDTETFSRMFLNRSKYIHLFRALQGPCRFACQAHPTNRAGDFVKPFFSCKNNF